MPLLSTNYLAGNNALENYESSAIMQAQNSMYNDAVRRANMEALGSFLVSGGRAGLKTGQAYEQMKQQNQKDQGGGDGSLSGAQYGKLFGQFINQWFGGTGGMGGASGGGTGSTGGAAPAAGASGGGG